MRDLSVLLTFMAAASSAFAAGPTYPPDPFNDADFKDAPLILDVSHPSRGRGEASLMYAGSVIDKYTQHRGLMLQFDYAVTQTLGVGLTFGFMHGQLTNIVTDDAGIIGNKVGGPAGCVTKGWPNAPECQDINPNVPDYKQMTGVVDALVFWQPLYGKINVVSELDVNLQAFVLAGLGINGRRKIEATVNDHPVAPSDYTLAGGGLGEGGLFGDPNPHLTLGTGLQVFLLDWLSLRAEVRGYISRETFQFEGDSVESSYLAQYWFFQTGLGFILF
ncbi:MAG: outer membrane beta-barrel domain-containing protein [Deltaproteobacteria bacterium]|nr:outer membrane beta-barrel domain-containing protein [Deltaproteobacteria bacterium]